MLLEEEDFDYEGSGDKNQDGDWDGDNFVCPKSPLDYEYEEPNNDFDGKNDDDDGWTGVCENLNSTDSRNNSQNQNNTATFLHNVSGAGASKGLSVIVDSLACGWLSSNVFEGIKVIFTYNYIFKVPKHTKIKLPINYRLMFTIPELFQKLVREASSLARVQSIYFL